MLNMCITNVSWNLLIIILFLTGRESLPNVFIGCYSTNPEIRKVHIDGLYTSSKCIGVCQKKYYRYAMTQENVCYCSNFLGSEYGLHSCADICPSCSLKNTLFNVHYTGVIGPGPPRDLQVYNVTDTSVYLSWKEPESYLDIKQYEIKAQILHTFSQSNMLSPKWIFSNNTFDTELNFHSGTKYSINLYAVAKDGEGISASKIVETEIGIPDNIPSTPNILMRDGTTMMVQLNAVINNNGPITAYQVIVMNDELHQIVEINSFKSYSESLSEGINYYITGQIMPNELLKTFVVGTGQEVGGFYNVPLNLNVNYRVLLHAISHYNNITKSVCSNWTSLIMQTKSIGGVHHTEEDQNGEIPHLIIGLYIAIGLSSFVLVVGIVGFFFLTKKISSRQRHHSDTQELTLHGPIIEVENNGYVPDEEIKSINNYESLCKRVWSIPITALKIQQHCLGVGKFGRIAGGIITKDDQNSTVAIYTITDKRLGANKVSMLNDLNVSIQSGKNENVLTLIGISETPESLFIVLEYASINLKDLLLGSRESLPGRFTDMKEVQAIAIGIGIAAGMKHLECLKICHKQLCARNILITESFVPKISGFGLAQYYNPNLVPDYTRWTASEAFNSANYISKCDIWSFACVLWEICVLGGTPYGSIPNNEIPQKILNGLRLPQLPYISDSLYELMLNCWQLNVDERSSFIDLVPELESLNKDNKILHLNFSKYAGFQYEQFYPDLELAARTVF